MSASKDIEIGFRTYGKAIGFIFTKGLWWYFVFPIALNVILFFGGFALIDMLIETVQSWLLGSVGMEGGDDAFFGNLFNSFLTGFVWLVFKVLFFFVFAWFGGYIILILLSPVFAFLSEKTEKILTGNDYPFNGDQLMRDVVRGVLIACRNLLIELGWIIVLFLISFIPVIGFLTTIVLFIISAYFYGFSFMDYTNERRRLSISESVKFIRKHKWLAVTNGAVFALLLLLPFCGVTLAGFAAIIAVVAATLAVHETVNLKQQPSVKEIERPGNNALEK